MSQGQYVLQREETRAAEEAGLCALLDYFCWDADGARGDFAEGGGEGVGEDYVGAGLGVGLAVGGLGCEEGALDAIIDDEEGGGGRGRAKEDGWEAGVDTAEGLA